MLQGIAGILQVSAIVYYFMCIHRLIRVMGTQPDWWSEYTPAGVVWRTFVPFYGIYVLYQWTGDVESYTNWRLGISSRVGLLTFAGLMIGSILSLYQPVSGLGYLIEFASLLLLYKPIRRALLVPAPTASSAPRYDGTLGLR
jgi:hypothetical protein